MGRGFFLTDWHALKLVLGGPEGTLEELAAFLRGNVLQPQKPVRAVMIVPEVRVGLARQENNKVSSPLCMPSVDPPRLLR
jgi:hypothetical protein